MLPYAKHEAVVTIKADGYLKDGDWVEGTSSEITIKGRYVPGNNGNQTVRNDNGNVIIYKAKFMTNHPKIDGATRIKVESKGIDAEIECWYPYDTHNEIYI